MTIVTLLCIFWVCANRKVIQSHHIR